MGGNTNQRIHDYRAEFDAFLEAAVNAIIIIDRKGLIELFSPAAERLFGYSSDEVIGRNVSILMPQPYRTEHDGYIGHYHRTHEAKVIGIGRQVEAQKKDGGVFPIDLSIGEIESEGRDVRFLGIIRDVTEQQRVHRELEESRDQLEERVRQLKERTNELAKSHAEAIDLREKLSHGARIGMLGEMATAIAHEINQPLTAISSYAQACSRMIEADTTDSKELQDTLQKVAEQALRAGDIIRRLRTFARKSKTRREYCDVNKLAMEVTQLVEDDAALRGITFHMDFAETLPTVLADAVQIQQVILNLIRNGMEAMSQMNADTKAVGIRTSLIDDGDVLVDVRDDGAGLPKSAEQEIFQPYFTTKDTGMGMGLSICHTIVTSHGGRLWFTRNAEGGTTFHFTLPASIGGDHEPK